MARNAIRFLSAGLAALIAACGGGNGSAPNPMLTSQTGTVSMVITDASSEDWATIGVKVLSIALVPQGGGGNVAVYTAPRTVPLVNLAQLDQIAEILGNATVPAGTYTGAVLTISANPGHAQGMAPNLTASVKVNFVAPFNGPLHHRPLHELTPPVPRHMYGDVTSIASDNASIMVTKEFPVEPAVSPETAVATTQSLQILVDSTNGTIFYDVDAKSHSVIKDFSSESNLPGKSVRIAARYREDGTLVATRIWASSQFDNVVVASESGGGVDQGA
jgi:Domain of unknown function (DUF4382)